MPRLLMLLVAALMGACTSVDPKPADGDATAMASVPASSEQARIRELLDQLYQSFNYAPDEEPDWELMRSCFLDGAVFVLEPASGQPIEVKDIDVLIADWQQSMRRRGGRHAGYAEWIDQVRVHASGKVAYVDVAFHGRRSDDTRARQPGLDSLMLILEDGAWKVVAFTVQYEAKP